MYFHRRLLFNQKYGRVGLVAMPYFLIFEMIGPLIEIQGYLAVLCAAVFGMLITEVALLLFIGSILMGLLVSISSLLITEYEVNYFSFKELSLLILFAVLENFGIRQGIGLWRITGYINSLRKPKGWGQIARRGFTAASPTRAQ
jgi:hypothetical protein